MATTAINIQFNKAITVAQLRTWFAYDKTTGILTRKHRHKSEFARPCRYTIWASQVGAPIAGKTPDGYVRIIINHEHYYVHRLIWLYVTGTWPASGYVVDHINGVRDDNKQSNLRLLPSGLNSQRSVSNWANEQAKLKEIKL